MTVSADDFVERFPEFESVEEARIELFLDDAALELDTSRWGDRYDKGQALLAAHYLTLSLKAASGATSSAGAVSSKSIGDVSVSYAVASSLSKTEDFYSSTIYGLEYLVLARFVGAGAVAIA